jgi:hypothetical protein
MKAVFHTGVRVAWGEALGGPPWCLVPVGGKPLIEYWLEWAAELGVDTVRLVLGDGADHVEAYCGDGSRWGLQITYSFFKGVETPEAYLRRSPTQWEEGLLYIAAPLFPRRLHDSSTAAEVPPRTLEPAPEGAWLLREKAGGIACFLSRQAEAVRTMIGGNPPDATGPIWASHPQFSMI